MSKESVLADFEALTIEQSTIISINTTTATNQTLSVTKTTNGSSYTGDLADLIGNFYMLSPEDREWIIAKFYILNVQSMGGRPDCPIC